MKILILEGDVYNAITGFRKDLFLELEKEYDVYIAGSIAYDREEKELLLNNKKIFLLGKLHTGIFTSLVYLCRLLYVMLKVRPDICLSFNLRPNLF